MTTNRLLLALSCSLLLFVGAPAAEARLKVVTSTQDLQSIATLVGGDRIETFAIAKGYQDPHSVDAKPSLILKLASADLLVVAGLELEIGYLPPLLDQARNSKIRPGAEGFLDASTGCDIVRPLTAVTRAMGDAHPQGNPHYWTDPANGFVIARALAAKLTSLDPAGKELYAKNLASFEGRLAAKVKEWDAKLAPFAGAKIVTFHDSWPNFAKHFRLEIAGHVEPKPRIPPTPSHTLEIINLIRDQKIRAILVEPYFDQKTPQSIAEQSGAKALVFYPSVGGKPGLDDYFAVFDADVDALAKALSGK
jgi:zinc/manganese transport system substrate-binding protein